MAMIDEQGIREISEKLRNPLESIYTKLDKQGLFSQVSEEFDFIYKFLDEIENSWDKSEREDATVIVNGKVYKPEEGR
jgi:uncharacterized protein YutE (UPF0331/DUF86 family)